MKNKYLKFSLEKLLEDKDFISWALHGIHKNEWNSFLAEHPDFSNTAQKAKEIVFLLKDRYDVPDRGDVLTMWQNIESYYTAHQKKGRTLLLKKVFRYAAIIFMVVTIGTTAYWYFAGSNQRFKFASGDSIPKSGEAKLILPNGEEVHLKKDNSSIVIKGKEAILINNEQSIDLRNQQQVIEEDVKMNEVIIPYGKKSLLVLDDGTKVWLCAGSRLAFPTMFTGKKREVYLEGEAYFEVAHNSEKPFYVNANDVTVKVLGTNFYMSSYSEDKEILTVLMEGSISINSNNALGMTRKPTVIEPGQKAVFNKQQKNLIIDNEEDIDIYTAWTKGWFNFSKENVFDVFNKLERYYNVKFIYGDNFKSDDLLTGKLDLKEGITDVLITLSELTDMNYKVVNDSIYVNPRQK